MDSTPAVTYYVVDTYDKSDLLVRSQPHSRDMANMLAMAESHKPHIARAEVIVVTELLELTFVNGALVPSKTDADGVGDWFNQAFS